MSNCAIAVEPFPFMAEQSHHSSEQNDRKMELPANHGLHSFECWSVGKLVLWPTDTVHGTTVLPFTPRSTASTPATNTNKPGIKHNGNSLGYICLENELLARHSSALDGKYPMLLEYQHGQQLLANLHHTLHTLLAVS